jgi:hypothetical protein
VEKGERKEEGEIGEIRGGGYGYEGVVQERKRGRRYILIYFIE